MDLSVETKHRDFILKDRRSITLVYREIQKDSTISNVFRFCKINDENNFVIRYFSEIPEELFSLPDFQSINFDLKYEEEEEKERRSEEDCTKVI